ncbi:unnamed protein product [Ceratitis capitata]|uniref:(Mediterranean fruit fly) hypothetical protein n=1 Tax=Ceratitis capitata TaxID=7213 RepID=A0A811UGD1_CERCA|nr:unnamed protein product [Ceratitis capitata]
MDFGAEDNLTVEELHFIGDLDSRQFGFLKLTAPENAPIRIIVERAVKILQNIIISAKENEEGDKTVIKSEDVPENTNSHVMKTEQGIDELLQENSTQVPVDFPSKKRKEEETANQKSEESVTTQESGDNNKLRVDDMTYCKLGHLHLLLEEYDEDLKLQRLQLIKNTINCAQKIGKICLFYMVLEWCIFILTHLDEKGVANDLSIEKQSGYTDRQNCWQHYVIFPISLNSFRRARCTTAFVRLSPPYLFLTAIE